MDTIGKQHFTSLYSPARDVAFSKGAIIAAWNKASLFLFNPDRVLSGMSKSTSETPKSTNETSTANRPQKVISVQDTILRTPVTPVSMEALMTLQNMIVQQDACTLDEKSKGNLGRHLKKLARAASTSLAKNAL